MKRYLAILLVGLAGVLTAAYTFHLGSKLSAAKAQAELDVAAQAISVVRIEALEQRNRADDITKRFIVAIKVLQAVKSELDECERKNAGQFAGR